MRRDITLLTAFWLTAGACRGTSSPATPSDTTSAINGIVVPAALFGMGVQHPSSTFPLASALGPLPVAGLRLWDSGVHWSQVETCEPAKASGVSASDPANPCYTWATLDRYVNVDAPLQPMDVLYTFGIVPEWAADSTRYAPPAGGCSSTRHACLPPRDVNPDGTGADSIWISFVTALVTRYKGKIQFYEIWNEPDATNFWNGTIAGMVRMSRDAAAIVRSIDPAARLVSPSFHGPSASTWLQNQYLASGGGPYFDILNFHGRSPTNNADPESFLGVYNQAEAVIQATGLAGRPFWDDESGPLLGQVADADNSAAYVSRAYILHASVGMARYYYAQWDGQLPIGLVGTVAATAYAVTASWLVGATIAPCVSSGTRWTCALGRASGYRAEVIWDTSARCSGGTCTTTTMTVDPQYVRYRDLANGSAAISGGSVPVGIKPILVENR